MKNLQSKLSGRYNQKAERTKKCGSILLSSFSSLRPASMSLSTNDVLTISKPHAGYQQLPYTGSLPLGHHAAHTD